MVAFSATLANFLFFFSAINDAIFNYKYFVVGINEQIKITQSMNTRVLCCLVPRPHYYARPMRFGSRGRESFRGLDKLGEVRHFVSLGAELLEVGKLSITFLR